MFDIIVYFGGLSIGFLLGIVLDHYTLKRLFRKNPKTYLAWVEVMNNLNRKKVNRKHENKK